MGTGWSGPVRSPRRTCTRREVAYAEPIGVPTILVEGEGWRRDGRVQGDRNDRACGAFAEDGLASWPWVSLAAALTSQRSHLVTEMR